MSETYDKINPVFVQMLKTRGVTPAQVLEQAGVGRSHGIQVFLNKRPGSVTRRKLAKVLTVGEMFLLGWVPGDDLLTVEELVDLAEDKAIETALTALELHQNMRRAQRRIANLVAQYPDFFGEVAQGENYLEVAALKMEAFLKAQPERQAA